MARISRVYTREDWPLAVGGRLRRRLAGLTVELGCDVVVIGSGAGGGVVAAELAEAGYDVIVLEEGSYYPTERFTAETTASAGRLYRDGGISMAVGDPPVIFTEGRAIGGSTAVNGGMSWRTPERVLWRWREIDRVERIEPDDLEPVFERVERMISAGTQDPGTESADNELLRRGAEAKGWRVINNIRNQFHCAGANNCAFGCPTGAKQSTLVSYLPRASAHGARIFADCRVQRLIRRGDRIVGVRGEVRAADGRAIYGLTVDARHVVVACGSIQTPALLARSGIRSPSRRLGHNLSLHPNVKVVALFDHEVEGFKGVHQQYQVREFEQEGLLMAAVNVPPALVAMSLSAHGDALGELMQDYNRMVVAGVLVEDTVTGRVITPPAPLAGDRPLVLYQLSERDRQRFLRGAALTCELMFAAGARRIYLPFEGVPPLQSADEARRLADLDIPRGAMEVATVHVMGTCAMGSDRKRHVCDSYGRVYGYQGLTVADASLFPSPVGVNPMQTVMALATRNAHRLADQGLS